MSSRNWPSEELLKLDVFKAAGNNPGSRENALALANNAYLRAEAIWKTYGGLGLTLLRLYLTNS